MGPLMGIVRFGYSPDGWLLMWFTYSPSLNNSYSLWGSKDAYVPYASVQDNLDLTWFWYPDKPSDRSLSEAACCSLQALINSKMWCTSSGHDRESLWSATFEIVVCGNTSVDVTTGFDLGLTWLNWSIWDSNSFWSSCLHLSLSSFNFCNAIYVSKWTLSGSDSGSGIWALCWPPLLYYSQSLQLCLHHRLMWGDEVLICLPLE